MKSWYAEIISGNLTKWCSFFNNYYHVLQFDWFCITWITYEYVLLFLKIKLAAAMLLIILSSQPIFCSSSGKRMIVNDAKMVGEEEGYQPVAILTTIKTLLWQNMIIFFIFSCCFVLIHSRRCLSKWHSTFHLRFDPFEGN